jgi:hypothetical protein
VDILKCRLKERHLTSPSPEVKSPETEFRAALFVRPQVRDILIGAMIETMSRGHAVDFSGNKIAWPDGGRIPNVAFGFEDLPNKVQQVLSAWG